MVNPVSSVRRGSKLIYSKHSLVIFFFPVPDKYTHVCLTGSLKNISVCKICYAANFKINIWVIFSVFLAFFPGLGSRDSTNQSGSYHLSGIISGMTHQKWLFLENCICVMLNKWQKEAWQVFHKPWLPCFGANGAFLLYKQHFSTQKCNTHGSIDWQISI